MGNANASHMHTHVLRTHANPAPCVFYFNVYVRNTLDLSIALTLSTIRLGRNMFWVILMKYFSFFVIDTRRIFMKVAQKLRIACLSTICVNVNTRDEFLSPHQLVIYLNLQLLNKSQILRVHF